VNEGGHENGKQLPLTKTIRKKAGMNLPEVKDRHQVSKITFRKIGKELGVS